MSGANREQIDFWNVQAGPLWVRHQARLDRQIRPHGERALARLAPQPGERVLDVGCGCGDSSLALGRQVGPAGSVLGIDVSEPMLHLARRRAAAEGAANVRFLLADAQTTSLEANGFDALFSRFGVMFFEDPVAAFQNLRRALRSGGRLCFVCWQPPQRNPWLRVPMAAVAPLLTLPPPPAPGSPGMFSFAEAERVRRILGEAGYGDVVSEDVQISTAPGGGHPDEAAETFMEVGPVAAALRESGADAALRSKVLAAVRASFEPYVKRGALSLDSAIWLVSAQNPA